MAKTVLDKLDVINSQMTIFEQDETPAQNYEESSNLLKNFFNVRWMGTNGPVWCSPKSPNVSLSDYSLFELTKTIRLFSLSQKNIIQGVPLKKIVGLSKNSQTSISYATLPL